MTDIVLGFAVEEAVRRVLSRITVEIKQAWGLDDELTRLRDSLAMVRALLQDAEDQQMTQLAIRRWLKKLKVWAYDAEDVLDDLAYEVLRQKVETENKAEAKVRNFLTFSRGINFFQKTAFHVKMVRKVKNVDESLDKIKNEAFGFGLSVISTDRKSQIRWNRVTDSIIDHPVVGREAEVSLIVDLLASSRDQPSLTVVAIVGMVGLGKTTVAKLACQEAIAKKLFDVKMWVCVSTDFDDQKILGEMLQTLNQNAGGLTNKDAICQHLAKELEGKSFLLVLDDVWNRESEMWDCFKSRLLSISKNNGNAVVVTTRSEEVAWLMETSPQCRHKLKLLSDEECWSVISERVSRDNGASIPSDLEAIGKEIASKCRGLPLAARVLGGTLHRNTRLEEWLAIKNSNVLNVSESKVSSIESILRLSFDRLPSHLKPCVAYCSIFPKSVLVWKVDLIHLWMAQGLLDSSMEDTGEKYFKELLLSSFLQDGIFDDLGNIIGARMHDLVHELVLSISKPNIMTWETCSAGNGTSPIKHLNMVPYGGPGGPVPVFPKDEAKTLRTLFIVSADGFYDSWKFKSLRTLRLVGDNVKELPASVGKLKHLRYLDVSCSKITKLPESLTKLYNLQTLCMFDCKLLEKLPKTLGNLVSLRHIGFSYEKQMPSNVGHLTNLRRLSFFVVGPDRGSSIQELERLDELRGALTISNLELVRDEEEAKKANLQSKRKIEELELLWSDERESSNCTDEAVLNGLQPFEDLKRLIIKYYLGEKFPSWLLTMEITRYGGDCCLLKNLMVLKLEGCRRCGELPRLGHLPHLRVLEIVGLDNVIYIGDEFYGSNGCTMFPALKRLILGSMNCLVEWKAPTLHNAFPCLEELRIFKCPKLTNIPISHLSSLVEFRIGDCHEFGKLLFDEGHPLTSLDLLHIKCCSNLVSIQNVQGLTSLRDLIIEQCNKLTSLPTGLHFCSSLNRLSIWQCHELTSVPDDLQELSSLNFLFVAECPKVSNFTGDILRRLSQLKSLGISCYYESFSSIQDIPSLDFLIIVGQNDINVLPDQLQSLTSLKSLRIGYFNGVEAFPDWLGNLSSLEYLEIWDCKNLKYLPSATALQSLLQLRQLRILRCPLLKECCATGSGSEWSKISHIPKIIVDGELTAKVFIPIEDCKYFSGVGVDSISANLQAIRMKSPLELRT
ncbi:putative disease resistance protein RGA3 isoform X3 [Euphorbia lathyris]|uniref:putative disease resistance protein RGA3 isoform X3 n=1 Tax=Euphorbia lathyris TaxID=212925 RepID=UPI0033135491